MPNLSASAFWINRVAARAALYTLFVQLVLPGATCQAATKVEKIRYPSMAPVEEYLIADESTEIALARSAAPASISEGAEVMVLRRNVAAKTFAPIYLMKTKLVLEGKSRAEILTATDSAFDEKRLSAVEAGAMCYMMSKKQYLSDQDMNWHPHLMFFIAGDAAKSWGANLPGSPVMAANDPEERVTIFLVWAGEWSDGTPAPSMMH
jgi:hypothetical protein